MTAPARHSARLQGAEKQTPPPQSWDGYPETKPETRETRALHFLNQQAYGEAHFARVDAMLVSALFGSKNRPGSSGAIFPQQATEHLLSPVDGVRTTHICYAKISKESPTLEQCSEAAQELVGVMPSLFFLRTSNSSKSEFNRSFFNLSLIFSQVCFSDTFISTRNSAT